MPLYATVLVGIVIFALFGVLFMFSVYWPLRKSTWGATIIISCLGAATVIKEFVKLIWGSNPLVYEPLIKERSPSPGLSWNISISLLSQFAL